MLRNVSKHFGRVVALNDLTVTFHPGVTVIVGENGAGKTTLLDIISGYSHPTTGSIVFDGQDLVGRRPFEIARRGVGRMFQFARLSDNQTVLVNALIAIRSRSIETLWRPLRSKREKVEELNAAYALLAEWGVADQHDSTPPELSLGQRKLLSLGCCIARRPSVLLLDEPLAGLFSEWRERVILRIDAERRRGTTLVVVEHERALMRDRADRVLFLKAGRKIAEGSASELLNGE